jgi:cobalt-zinc-cadmium efflux system protein
MIWEIALLWALPGTWIKNRKPAPMNAFPLAIPASLLGALINSLVLIAGSVFVVSRAIEKLLDPEPSNAEGMIIFALVGIAINGYAAWRLQGGKSLNEQAVSWHLLEDVLGWVTVLIVAIVLMFTDYHFLDPALSLLITSYVLWNVIK